MRRDTSLRLRVCSVTYVYVRALADTRRASSRSHLRILLRFKRVKIISKYGSEYGRTLA